MKFLKTYTLSQEKIDALSSVTAEFFVAYKQLCEIIEASSLLLSVDNQVLGSEILESLQMYQDEALNRVIKWMQTHTYLFQRDDEDFGLFPQVIDALKIKPAFLQ